jgi:hypothetical protein
MGRILNPIVAEANANLYSAAVQANLSPSEKVFLEQSGFASVEAKRLRALPLKQAKIQYNGLSEPAKNWLNYLYPDADYAKPDPSVLQKGLEVAGGVVKGVLGVIASPVIQTFKYAGKYGQVINTPYSVARQAYQDGLIGKLNFGSPTATSQQGINMPIPPNADAKWMRAWKEGYNGKNLYDDGAVEVANKKHGNVRVFVAQKILEGKKPGEILDEYGKQDEQIASAMAETLNEPDRFNKVLEDVKFAQTSPARDMGRMLERIDIKNGGLWGKFIAGAYLKATGGEYTLDQQKYIKQIRKSTGFVDGMYQIIIDPLTYITGGTAKAATSGGKLVENLLENQRLTGDIAASVKETFASRPEIRRLWDEQLGPEVEKLANAKTTGEKSLIDRNIRNNFPAYNRGEEIKILVDNRVFNANSAEEFFGQIENVSNFISGRLDGILGYRNGIATARNQRSISLGIARAADAIFNPSAAAGDFGARASALDKAGADYIGILKTAGDDITQGVNVAGIEEIVKVEEDFSAARKAFILAGRQMARNPGGRVILVGDDAIKTENNFRLTAQQLFTRDIADFLTYEFLDSTADEQIVILRNLYAGVMRKMGLHGIPRGNELIEEVLSKTFNNKSGMTTVENTEVPKEFADMMSKHILKSEDDIFLLQARGIIHPSQVARGIAALPYERIIQVTARARLTKNDKNILKIVDGATRNRLTAELVNIWTILTLVPRLGVRSAIDEAFFYAINAPLSDLFNYASGAGRKLGAVATGYTGSLAAVGPIKQAFNAIFRKGGPAKTLSGEQRVDLVNELSKKHNVPVEEITHMMIREEIADRIIAVWGKDSTINFEDLKDALVYHPQLSYSMANSLGARTSLAGAFDREILDAVFTPSVLTKAITDAELKVGRKFRPISTDDLKRANPKWLTLTHFDAFFRQFAFGSMGLPNGRTLNPTVVFFSHNGLRTADDFLKAKRDMLEGIGVSWDNVTESYFVKDADSVKEFLSNFGDTGYFRNKGLDDASIVESHADTMLWDMRYTFHGSGKKFNDSLMTLVKSRYDELSRYEKETGKQVYGKWEKAVANIPFEQFEKSTVGFQPRGRINTAIEFTGDLAEKESFLSAYSRYGDKTMEYMDRQVTGIFRQPAVTITYSRLREGYRGLEKEFVAQQKALILGDKPYMSADDAQKIAEGLGKKRFAEIAYNEAIESVLKYVDNPNIRSNFSLSVRNVARFYRATEDFWRRYYRLMREKPLQVIYRMRLAHQGLEARGDVYTDDYGESYLIMPTDSIINAAVEPLVRKLTGTDFVVPQFNDFTLKLRMTNPSFSPDAGAPVLSGPVAGVMLVGLRSMLGKLPGQAGIYGTKTGEFIDNWMLGDFGETIDYAKALIPLQLQNIAKMIPEEEMTRQEASAAIQSMSYVQAFGDKRSRLPENPTPEQLDNFLKAHKIAAHNLQFMKAFFGMFAPATLTPRESKGVPDYYKNNGVVTLRQEFFDILSTLSKEKFEEANDPYELAIAMFNGKNPNKTIYTISRGEKKTQFIIQKTNEVVNWSIENKKFIKQYGDAAWIFAPQIGEYTPDAFNYLESLDLISVPDEVGVRKYLDRMQTAVAKQRYFDIERRERESLAQTAIVSERRTIIYKATQERQALTTAYPLLKVQLEEAGLGVGEEEMLLKQVQTALVDKNTPISDIQRKKVSIAVKLVQDFISFAKDENIKRTSINFVDAKRNRKEAIQKTLLDLTSGDAQIKELNRRVLDPILGFYSRDVYRIIGVR